MARRTKDRCVLCGDGAELDANWRPTGRCAACAAPAVKEARKDIRAHFAKDDDEVIVERVTFLHVKFRRC